MVSVMFILHNSGNNLSSYHFSFIINTTLHDGGINFLKIYY